MTTVWTREQLGLIDPSHATTFAFASRDVHRILPHLYLWDIWPVRRPDGIVAKVDDLELWMALSVSSELEPSGRHDVAHIRLISRAGNVWADLGPLFPEGASLGSREWAGCATSWPDGTIEVLYTAVGRRSEIAPTFMQRVVRAVGTLDRANLTVHGWAEHEEIVKPGNLYTSTADQNTGEPGFIKAFRDPFRFQDPASGNTVVLFTASMIDSTTDFDGAIGAATGTDASELRVVPPLLTADGVNNELERPHLVHANDRYYLFFSTQTRTFHPAVTGVTGLYGFVSDDLWGEWTPLNGSGLVLANPPDEPFQAYSWLVLNDMSVYSFVDFHRLGGRSPEHVEQAGLARAHFGGTLAPVVHLEVEENRARLASG